jgi:hypothetical protein
MLANHFELECSVYDREDKPFIKLELEEAMAWKDTWFVNKEVYVLSHCLLLSRSGSTSTASSLNADHVVHPDFNLADPETVTDALVPLTGITHVFYAASYARSGVIEDENHESNCNMLQHVLFADVPNCPAIVHVCF